MIRGERSLRSIFDKWAGRTSANPVRITRLRHARSKRNVKVVLATSQTEYTIFFFCHDDGTWHVFPPNVARPVLRIGKYAA
ncbi:hypothetical protein PTE30175_01745 [Pandoraea terrae]|uniref:Uncharacterized protein n=1 Tax=Pandoraea terrae TaxID=1537710 RepID=A0A5E4U405_9BURK|nr:hypothetical protein PTE30175_01745 [Pandoraea terrae]